MNKLFSSIFIPALLLAACSNKNNVITIKDCELYQLDGKIGNIDILFFENSKDVPYVEISDGISKITESFCSCDSIDKTHAIIRDVNSALLNIDFETTAISYINFDKLAYGKPVFNENEIYDYENYVGYNHEKIQEESEFVKGSQYSIKLSDFGFHFEKYQDKYYAPIDLVSYICYRSESYYYENNAIYCLPIRSEELKQKISFNHSFTKAYYEHCFNIYMLSYELMSGIKGNTRKQLSDGVFHTYFKNGVAKTLLPYKENIINSATIEEFDKAMMEMLAKELNSGGHDNVASKSFNSKQKYIYGSEYDVTDFRAEDIKKERTKSVDKEDFSKNVYAYDTDEDGKKDIGYLTFDKFVDLTEELDDGTKHVAMFELLSGENGVNTLFNPNSKTYDSTKYDIKDVVIDLTANEGGYISASHPLAAWLCGGKFQMCYKMPNTGTYNKLSYKYDINNDGIYDEQDYLPSSVNIYILTSNGSYSAANEVPFICYCYNKNGSSANKIRFMGERPAGGCCPLTSPIYLATGFSYYQSDCCSFADFKDATHSSENEIPTTSGLELTLTQMVDHTGPNGTNNLIRSKR